MNTRRSKRILPAAAGLLGYLLLLVLLVRAEAGADGASIRSLPGAFWYSVTTLTTVGYGDLYPVTPAGRLIGLIFQLMSLGVLAAVVSLILQLLRGDLLLRLQLRRARSRTWYLFPENNEASLLMALALRREEPDCVILLPSEAKGTADSGLRAVFTGKAPEELVGLAETPDHVTVFLMDGDGSANESRADALYPSGCRICLLSDAEPERIPERVTRFQPAQAAARLYWHRYPVTDPAETIVLVGGGRYGRALLEQALLVNVIAPDQALRYTLCGDWSEFLREHPDLPERFLHGSVPEFKDVLQVVEGSWNRDWQLFRTAGRIIFCEDDEAVNADMAASLLRFSPVRGTVYARLPRPMDGVVRYGSPEELYTPELVLRRRLSRLAIRLHENYLASSGGSLPPWDNLGGFLRRSNLASADHLPVKARILTASPVSGESGSGKADLREAADRTDGTEPNYRAAADRYQELSADGIERCRRIEHERWCRFHLLSNWSYGPVRDNAARVHPLLCPFGELSAEDQAKDDYAWQLLAQAASEQVG